MLSLESEGLICYQLEFPKWIIDRMRASPYAGR